MEKSKPSPALLDEYGLTEYTYDALKACEHPTYWKQDRLTHSIASLYNLRDRGLLSGPLTGKPYSEPFHLTDAGRDLLSRVERGLHKPEWLSEHKARALEWLAERTGYDVSLMRPQGISLTTLRSLEKNGYLESQNETLWRITDVGLEAWAVWRRFRSWKT